jgi:hypothetical protein
MNLRKTALGVVTLVIFLDPCTFAGTEIDYLYATGNRLSKQVVRTQDSDADGLPDLIEKQTCTDPLDADTDDDGISDGVEDANLNGMLDSGETDPCNPDSDGDGIQDGTELGYTLSDIGPDTDTNLFQPDLNPTTTTDPLNSDTDGDGLTDGQEDRNRNGWTDTGERDPEIKDNTFDADSAQITNAFMALQVGDRLDYVGTGAWEGYGRYIEATGTEELDSVNCLKIQVRGHGNHPDPKQDPQWDIFWVAEDTDQVVWLFQVFDAQREATIFFGKSDAVVWMPANPVSGQVFGNIENAYFEILETGRSAPVTGTGLNPYTDCLKIRWSDGGSDENLLYLAKYIGSVQEIWNDGGQLNGWKIEGSETIPTPINNTVSHVFGSGGAAENNEYRILHTAGQPLIGTGSLQKAGFWHAVMTVTDADSDDDGIPDVVEDANQNGVVDPGETDPFNPDTDGDGIQDGTEQAYTLGDIGPDTDTALFQPDLDPATTTDPLNPDTDDDSLSDGQEDPDHNGRVDEGERDPADRDYVFGKDSAKITNPYLSMQLGNKLSYVGTGTWEGHARYIEAVDIEVVDSISCLKLVVKGHGNDPDPEKDPQWCTLWVAQDAEQIVWLFKYQDTLSGLATTFGKAGAVLWIPANPAVGQVFGQVNGAFSEIMDIGVSAPEMSTGLGPYSNCLKVRSLDAEGHEVIKFIAANEGSVVEEWDAGGQARGWELMPPIDFIDPEANRIKSYIFGTGGEAGNSDYKVMHNVGQPLIGQLASHDHGAGFWYTVALADRMKLVVDFGFDGLYTFDGSSWRSISNANPEGLTRWNSLLAVDFGNDGIDTFDGLKWENIAAFNPEGMTAWSGLLVADFGWDGIDVYDGVSWNTVNDWNPEEMVNWNGLLVADFENDGIYTYNGDSWENIATSNPDGLIPWRGLLIASNENSGIVAFDGSSWVPLLSENAENLIVWKDLLVADLGADGIHTYDGITWNQISTSDPEHMTAWEDVLAVDFGSNGIYTYNGKLWTKIANADPEDMIAW